MFRLHLLWFLLFYVVCAYCGKDFIALGRHQWRCKKRMPINLGPKSTINTASPNDKDSANVVQMVKFCCGKTCKGAKGLKMHQRRCRTLESISEDSLHFEKSNSDPNSLVDNNHAADNLNTASFVTGDTADTKPVDYLPKTSEQWVMASDFFKHALADIDIDSRNADINSAIRLLNTSIYNNFKENYGTVKSQNDKELVENYKECSTHSLKKALQGLNLVAAPVNEIRYVSLLLRSKLSHKSASSSNSTDDYEKHISKNFWGFVTRVVDKPFRILPSFSREAFTRYFQRPFSFDSPNRQFSIPSWFPSLPQPTVSFICEPPSYEKVTRVIRRMKASGSTCSLDQISVIFFKRFPFLRTVLTRILC